MLKYAGKPQNFKRVDEFVFSMQFLMTISKRFFGRTGLCSGVETIPLTGYFRTMFGNA